MKLTIFSIFDVKAAAFLPPFYMVNRSTAERAFLDSVSDPGHMFCKHPEDYVLHILGTFEDADASFTLEDFPAVAMTGLQAKAILSNKE